MPDDQNHPAQTAGQPAPQAEPLRKLLDYCDDSDGSCYGTLATDLVRKLVNEALAAQAGAVQPAAPAELVQFEYMAGGVFACLVDGRHIEAVRAFVAGLDGGTAPKAEEPHPADAPIRVSWTPGFAYAHTPAEHKPAAADALTDEDRRDIDSAMPKVGESEHAWVMLRGYTLRQLVALAGTAPQAAEPPAGLSSEATTP